MCDGVAFHEGTSTGASGLLLSARFAFGDLDAAAICYTSGFL